MEIEIMKADALYAKRKVKVIREWREFQEKRKAKELRNRVRGKEK